jgi:ribosomal 50S subunit-recycling heat shock protein
MDKVEGFIADERDVRLDKYVCQQLPELSRARVQKLIADGHITVNGQPAKPGLKLNIGDKIKVIMRRPKSRCRKRCPLISSMKTKTF